MKRRHFIRNGAAGTVGLGLSGCGMGAQRHIKLWKELAPFYPEPRGGSIPVRELGTTGIKVSTFGFRSHIRAEMRKFDRQREYIIREAFDLGVNIFDVYDEEEGVKCTPMSRQK